VKTSPEGSYYLTDEGKEALRIVAVKEPIKLKPSKRYKMTLLSLIAICTLVVLAFSIYVSYAQYNQNQQLSSAISNLNNSFSDLNQNYAHVVNDLNYYNDLINQNSSFLTPISESQAIRMALAYGGWNATSLEGYWVNATLLYVSYTDVTANSNITTVYIRFGTAIGNSSSGIPIHAYILSILNTVVEPVADYSPVTDGNTTYHYTWEVFVHPGGVYTWEGPAAFCFIDAATGEILSYGPYPFTPD
jgi:cell division protein FtsL